MFTNNVLVFHNETMYKRSSVTVHWERFPETQQFGTQCLSLLFLLTLQSTKNDDDDNDDVCQFVECCKHLWVILYICLSVCLLTYLCDSWQSTCLFAGWSVGLSDCLSVSPTCMFASCQTTCLSVGRSLSVGKSVHMYVCPPVCLLLSVCLSVHLSFCLTLVTVLDYLSVCLHTSLTVHLFIFLSHSACQSFSSCALICPPLYFLQSVCHCQSVSSCALICPPVHLSQSVCFFMCSDLCTCSFVSVNLFLHVWWTVMSTCSFVSVCFFMRGDLSTCSFVSVSLFLHLWWSVHLFICFSLFLHALWSVHLSLFCLFIYSPMNLSTCLHAWMFVRLFAVCLDSFKSNLKTFLFLKL